MNASDRIAARIAAGLPQGALVNLGIGLPTRVAAHLPADGAVRLHGENGGIGFGPAAAPGEEDPDLIDAGGRYVTVRPGAAFVDSTVAFGLARAGAVHACVLGAFQVGANGDLANWRGPGGEAPGVGGAMELAQRVPCVIIATRARDRAGAARLRYRCDLPLTARGAVSLVVTESALLAPAGDAFRLLELAPGATVAQVQNETDAEVIATDPRPWGATLLLPHTGTEAEP